MTAATLLAQAAEADRAADEIFAKLSAAPKRPHPDGGCYAYPAGSAGEVQRACDLKRRASYLRTDAAEIVQDSAARMAIASAPPPAANAPATNPAKPVAPIETADTVAARILSSDSTAPVRALAPKQGLGADAVETADDVARRILESDQ